jgi:hypothetical protein
MVIDLGTKRLAKSEECGDHPVIDRSLRRTASQAGYGDRCSQRWRAFVSRLKTCTEPHAHVLEGCYFQSTVRFLLEHDRPKQESRTYLIESERSLATSHACLIYLTQPVVGDYLENILPYRKGVEVVRRIASYAESTPFARSRGLRGMQALLSLYSGYRGLCDSLVRSSILPRLEIDTVDQSPATVKKLVCA